MEGPLRATQSSQLLLRPLLRDQVQPLAVGAFAFVAVAYVLVGALDHVGAGGRRGDEAGFLPGARQVRLLAYDRRAMR